MDLSEIKLQKIKLPFPSTVNLYVLRLDLIDMEVSGNKWFKLKKNLEEAAQKNIKHIITFGGAFSNHIAATAKACKMNSLACTGIIRGENIENHTLAQAQANGMHLRFVSRSLYRDKLALMDWLCKEYHLENYLVIPEGGANAAGIEGCKEIISTITIPFDYIAVACGTGTTLAGVIQTLENNHKALGFSALKGGSFLNQTITQAIPEGSSSNFSIIDAYHFGGYAKYNSALISFIHQFEKKQGFQLDFVYTAKMMYGLFDLIQQHYFPENATIVAIHSGGIQGNAGIGI